MPQRTFPIRLQSLQLTPLVHGVHEYARSALVQQLAVFGGVRHL